MARKLGPRTAAGSAAARGDRVASDDLRTRDAARTQADLLHVAAQEFSRLGFFGARVDEIAARSQTTKRMIYYYFGDKEGLYAAVLKKAYADIRAAEQALQLDHLPPAEAMERLVRFTLDYHATHPHLAHLVATENALEARHLRDAGEDGDVNLPIIALIDDILTRGVADGVFKPGIHALEIHLVMTSLALFRVTNVATVRAIFGVDMTSVRSRTRAADVIVDLFLSWLRAGAGADADADEGEGEVAAPRRGYAPTS